MHRAYRWSRISSAAIVLAIAAPAAVAQGALDGRTFDAALGYTGKPPHVKQDILSFAGGRFHSSDCDQYGYDRGSYQATASGDAITFEAETRSERYGRNVWKGVVRGDQVEGTMVFHPRPTWLKSNPEPIQHWFKGMAVR